MTAAEKMAAKLAAMTTNQLVAAYRAILPAAETDENAKVVETELFYEISNRIEDEAEFDRIMGWE
jgi:hypothetical protein